MIESSDTYNLIIIFVAKEWCCSILRKYPDLIPLVKWGNTITASEKKTWTASGCNDKVGGDQCPGIENIYMKSKVILLIPKIGNFYHESCNLVYLCRRRTAIRERTERTKPIMLNGLNGS